MKTLRLALAGNPNSGKTTLFNALTGSTQYVGNWPGVTVEKKEGRLKKHKDVMLTDLPGVYSLSPYTTEEIVTRDYLLKERPDVIINIVDGTNLERNLYLTTQLTELGIPVVVAINLMDLVQKNGDTIHLDRLSADLGTRVVEISALKETGLEEAVNTAIMAAAEQSPTLIHPYEKPVEDSIVSIMNLLDEWLSPQIKRWYAIKLFERDSQVSSHLTLSKEKKAAIEDLILSAEEALDDDAESLITAQRYNLISSIIKDSYHKKHTGKLTTSDKIDRVVTNRWAALPIFALVMFLVYFISVTTIGAWATDWTNDGLFGDGWHLFSRGSAQYEEAMDGYVKDKVFTPELSAQLQSAKANGITGAETLLTAIQQEDTASFLESYDTYHEVLIAEGYLQPEMTAALEDDAQGKPAPEDFGIWVPGLPVLAENALTSLKVAPFLQSLIVDGIIAGVGAVLGFVPQMIVLFLLLSFLEACGYMARIAFILDRVFRRFGLSGKSFIPMLIGTGCSVPGVMATRTIENLRDRRMTIIVTSFMPCSAKMPIIALLSATLFGGAWWIAPSAYFLGIAAIVLSGILLKKTRLFVGDPAPFVMELPAYHWPSIKGMVASTWERAFSFIKRAGTVILLSSIVLWAGARFGVVNGAFLFDLDMELNNSVLGIIGQAISWVFAPLGFASINATIATLMGLIAKEEVVAVFGVLDFQGMTRLAGYSFLVFNLLCAPCFATIGAIRREMNDARWTWFAVLYQTGFAYVISLLVYQIGLLFGGQTQPLGLATALIILLAMLYLFFRPSRENVNHLKMKQV